MKTVYIFIACAASLLMFSPLASSQNGPPWSKTNVGFNYIFTGIDFPNNQDMIGYMAGESLTYNGNGIVLKTVDGGNTWVSKWTGANMGLEGACFVDENTGFIAGWPKSSSGWSGFGKTTNGGTTWTSPPVSPDVYFFTDVVFKDAVNGILVGAGNTDPLVYMTGNGGNSWTAATGVSDGIPYGACYVSGNKYFLVDNAGHIKKSLNNGLTWTTVYTVPGGLLTGIDFFNDNTGMACGDNGLIVKTYDGGATWQTQQYGTGIWHDFGWEDQDHVFACGTPEIVAESTNGGATWGNGFPGSTHQAALYECIFTNNGSGFICGSQGTLLKRPPSCEAGFTANQTNICADSSVSFTSLSTGYITSYFWYFQGGTPLTSADPDPVVTYHTPGVFDVALVVFNEFWSDSLIQPGYIAVTRTTAPVISSNGALLSSNIPTGNQWYRDGYGIPGATGPTHLATLSGRYHDVVTQNGCPSDTSNNLLIIIDGIAGSPARNLKVFQLPGVNTLKYRIESPGIGPCDLFLVNGMGVRIADRRAVEIPASGEGEFDPGSAPPGIYLFVLRTGSMLMSRKIIISE